ncbi:TetR/AcrR family transcriptional regulator [Streptosporangium amethystogenes subsp. fukuiense]|uniref:TetR/AcrR family transcriptional regulator n=1 Tax=Streptosporangium amethystogenes subsp. fukuiense TaxID=698418 RepID=A0ABW2TD77_9ACTN
MRRSAEAAQLTRDRIVATGVTKASSDGLHALTIGSLAETLGMSKAGVVGPFGSRAGLQSAVLTKAADMFVAAVVAPSMKAEPGLPRLRVLIDLWCGYLDGSPFPNGCFITAASCELDGRPGELRNLLLSTVTRWRTFLREQIVIARTAGDITATLDADDLVTTLTGIAMSADQEIQLLADATAAARARRLMLAAITR